MQACGVLDDEQPVTDAEQGSRSGAAGTPPITDAEEPRMRYTVYLEVQEDGATMAHVPALPGCISSGVTQEVAIARAPDAIAA